MRRLILGSPFLGTLPAALLQPQAAPFSTFRAPNLRTFARSPLGSAVSCQAQLFLPLP